MLSTILSSLMASSIFCGSLNVALGKNFFLKLLFCLVDLYIIKIGGQHFSTLLNTKQNLIKKRNYQTRALLYHIEALYQPMQHRTRSQLQNFHREIQMKSLITLFNVKIMKETQCIQ